MILFMSHSSAPAQSPSSVDGGVDMFKIYTSHKQCSILINVYRLREQGNVSLNSPEGVAQNM